MGRPNVIKRVFKNGRGRGRPGGVAVKLARSASGAWRPPVWIDLLVNKEMNIARGRLKELVTSK